MRVILLGKNGQVGWELQHTLPVLGHVTLLGRAELDLAAPATIQQAILDLKPDVIINASAYTEVDRAETQVELSNKVNALAPGIMAETARKIGAIFIHYSTDYVFDGTKHAAYIESDVTNPLNVYGKSKLDGEINIQQAGGAYLILRTSWVYSMRGHSFVNKVIQWSHNNKTLRIVQDQISNPTWARMLAEITTKLLMQNKDSLFDVINTKCGIYHLAGTGYASRYEWAREILANASKRTGQLGPTIEPALSEEFPLPAVRPLFSALNCAKFIGTFDLHLPEWRESLRNAMQE